MDSKAAAEVLSGGDVAVGPETTVEINIRTLDSQTHTIRVDKRVSVPALKEQIASVTGVLSEQQRLICRGKVLKDDQLLSAYHVEDGHTLHLVVREPHITSPASQTGTDGGSGPSSTTGNVENYGSGVPRGLVIETSNASQGDADASVIARMITRMLGSGMLGSIESASVGNGNFENDIREMISERLARASSDVAASDTTHSLPNLFNMQSNRRSIELDLRSLFTGPTGTQPTVIPDSLTTLSQYIGFMRGEFENEGFRANVREGSQAPRTSNAQVGLPTPASLAEVLHSARQLLMEQTGECLFQLASQLEDHPSVTEPLSRINIQTRAIRSGVLMQNLGSMLLELGRTTMTLRMGQNPAEAVVNAGPATFVSATAPNPLMVQAVPFTATGPAYSEQLDTGVSSRNIEIRIRRVPPATTGESEQAPADANLQQEETDQARSNSSSPIIDMRTFLAPLRPDGLIPPQFDSSMGSVSRTTIPTMPRFSAIFLSSQRSRPDNSNDSGTQAGADANRTTESHLGNATRTTDSARARNDQGEFLSHILRAIIPQISQGREHGDSSNNASSSAAVTEQENLNGSSSSQHQRDPPEAPSPKRMKGDRSE